MRPRTAIIILAIMTIAIGIFMVYLYNIMNMEPENVLNKNTADNNQSGDKTGQQSVDSLEASRLEILDKLNQEKATEEVTTSSELDREELLRELEEKKPVTSLTPEEKEKQRLEILEKLNSNK